MARAVSATGTITLTDSVGSDAQESKSIAASFTGTVSQSTSQGLASTILAAVELPLATVSFLYLKNLSSTATVTVVWTPLAGASATVQTLQPGSFILICQTAAGAGITALSLQASVSSTPYEMILAG